MKRTQSIFIKRWRKHVTSTTRATIPSSRNGVINIFTFPIAMNVAELGVSSSMTSIRRTRKVHLTSSRPVPTRWYRPTCRWFGSTKMTPTEIANGSGSCCAGAATWNSTWSTIAVRSLACTRLGRATKVYWCRFHWRRWVWSCPKPMEITGGSSSVGLTEENSKEIPPGNSWFNVWRSFLKAF